MMMDLDALLIHYFGTAEIDAVNAATVGAGQARLTLDFAIEREPGRRFALWALMQVLHIAPDPEAAFKGEREREAARRFSRLTQG